MYERRSAVDVNSLSYPFGIRVGSACRSGLGITETCPRDFRGRTLARPMTHPHPCLDCDHPGDLPQVDETGEMYGWLCDDCDRMRRRKQMRWKRRMKLGLR